MKIYQEASPTNLAVIEKLFNIIVYPLLAMTPKFWILKCIPRIMLENWQDLLLHLSSFIF